MPIGSEDPEGGTMKLIVLVFVAAVALVCSAAAQGWPVPSSQDFGGISEFIRAAGQGDIATMDLFLAAGECIDVQDPSTGWTALMAAIHGGRLEAVRYLLAYGAQVNVRDVNGCTALMCAGHCGDCDVVQALLAAGADREARNKDGLAAYDIARQAGCAEAASLLALR
jgi:ankyrin repeat protein